MAGNSSAFVEFSTEDLDVIRLPYVAVAMSLLYGAVILLGILGSAFVLVTIVQTPLMWNATNIFIANLAIADILMCVFNLPATLYTTIVGYWVFGEVLCHVIPASFGVLAGFSSMLLMLIALNRYILIAYPTNHRYSALIAVLMVIGSAAFGLLLAWPIALYSGVITLHSPSKSGWEVRSFCTEEWPSQAGRLTYAIISSMFQFFIPLTVSGFLYLGIFIKLRSSLRGVAHNKNRKKNRTNRMLLIVTTYFAVTWTPYQTYYITSDLHGEIMTGPYLTVIYLLLKILALSSACVNPILYGWLNETYRTAFLSLLGRRRLNPRGTAVPLGGQRYENDMTELGRDLAVSDDIEIKNNSQTRNAEVSCPNLERIPVVKSE